MFNIENNQKYNLKQKKVCTKSDYKIDKKKQLFFTASCRDINNPKTRKLWGREREREKRKSYACGKVIRQVPRKTVELHFGQVPDVMFETREIPISRPLRCVVCFVHAVCIKGIKYYANAVRSIFKLSHLSSFSFN